MVGPLIGAAAVFGVIALVRRRHRWHHRTHHGHGARGWSLRRTWLLRRLFERIDTTHGQERLFTSAADDLEGRVRELYSELEQLRKDSARSLRGSRFDGTEVRQSFARQRGLLETLEESLVGHLGKLHEALDERQRSSLAELIQDGPRRSMRRCGLGRLHHPPA